MNRPQNIKLCLLTLFLVFILSAYGQEQEEKEIIKTIEKLYGYLSFKDTSSILMDSLTSIFVPQGKLLANFGKQPVSWTVPQYILSVKKNLSDQGITAWNESELFHKTDIFGKIAQTFSAYEISFVSKNQTTVRRGINCIQLIKQNDKWIIVSLIWDRERDNLKIPLNINLNKRRTAFWFFESY
jgi:hypothetical protein